MSTRWICFDVEFRLTCYTETMNSYQTERWTIMKHVNADNQPEVVKQFLLSLDVHASGR